MFKKDYELWLDFHRNPKNNYSADELEEIRANEFAMHLLCPRMYVLNELLKLGLDFEKINNLSNFDKHNLYEILKNRFNVCMEVIIIKLDSICSQYINNDIDLEEIILNDFFDLHNKEEKKISIEEALTKFFPDTHDKLEKYLKEKYNIKSYTKIKKGKVLFDKKMNC